MTGTSFAQSEVKSNHDPHMASTERSDMNSGYNDGSRVASSLINMYWYRFEDVETKLGQLTFFTVGDSHGYTAYN